MLPPDAQLRAAVEANVRWSVHQLAETPEGRRGLGERRAMLVGAVYELSTGHVRFLDLWRGGGRAPAESRREPSAAGRGPVSGRARRDSETLPRVA